MLGTLLRLALFLVHIDHLVGAIRRLRIHQFTSGPLIQNAADRAGGGIEAHRIVSVGDRIRADFEAIRPMRGGRRCAMLHAKQLVAVRWNIGREEDHFAAVNLLSTRLGRPVARSVRDPMSPLVLTISVRGCASELNTAIVSPGPLRICLANSADVSATIALPVACTVRRASSFLTHAALKSCTSLACGCVGQLCSSKSNMRV